MSSTHTLIILVNSLTKTEKRYFHLYSNLQSGDKVYISLFNLIDSNTSPEDLYSCFCKIQNGRNFETAVKHLYRTILDCLVKLREKYKQEFSTTYLKQTYYLSVKCMMKRSSS